MPDFLFFLFITGDTGVFDVIVEKFTFDNSLKNIFVFSESYRWFPGLTLYENLYTFLGKRFCALRNLSETVKGD